MECKSCGSRRVAKVSGKTSDLCFIEIGGNNRDGYTPKDMGIGGGDYINFLWCLECGKIQGDFPLPMCEMETKE